MARCGRCGLWSSYPKDHPEQKYRGVCLWYQTRLHSDEVFEERACEHFEDRIPGLTPMGHFDYKVKRDNLGDAYLTARSAKVLAYVGIGISIVGLLLSLTGFALKVWGV